MKKSLSIIISALLCIPIAEAEISDKHVVSSSDNYSHWSIMLSGGFDMLITERMADWDEYKWEGRDFSGKGLYANYVDNFAPAGLFQADYMFTPQFGLRLQYLYSPINKKAIYVGPYYDENNNLHHFSTKNGQSHQATVQLEVNLLNLFYRCRQNTQWGWYIGAGVGALFYKIPTFDSYRPVVSVPVNTSVEYSPISSVSVVLHAELDWYGDDELNGWEDPDGQVNDMGLYVGVGLRYNISATKDPHVRLNDMCSYEPLTVGRSRKTTKYKNDADDDGDVMERQTDKEDIQELQDKMDELERRNRELQDKIDMMNREIMERLDKYSEGTSSGESNKNNSANTGKNTSKTNVNSSSKAKTTNATATLSAQQSKPVNVDVPTPQDDSYDEPNEHYYQPSAAEIKQQQIYVEAMQSNGTEANEVIFDLESSRVKAKYEIKVATVARRMLANKKLKLDIFAYLGKNQLTKTNVKLATDRLEAIYFILVNRYRIDPNRIRYDILQPSDEDEGSDIRCDMVYR